MKPLKPGENPFIVGSGDKPRPLPKTPAGGKLPKSSTQVEGSHTTEKLRPNCQE